MKFTDLDTIDVPTDRARDQLPIHLIQRGHPSWPDAIFEIFFDYNNSGGYWTWEVQLEEFGVIIGRQPVDYGKFYSFRDYIYFGFLDLSGDTEHVTPETLGAEVSLIAVPGLDSPGFDEWVEHQQTTEEEKAALIAEWDSRIVQQGV